MTVLAQLADRHPIATGLFGASAGFGAGLLEHLNILAGVMAPLGVIAGATLSILTLGVWLTRRVRTHRERRRHYRDDPFDELP